MTMNHLIPLIIESIQLMFIGMGTVFLLLTLMIFLISLVNRLLSAYAEAHPEAVLHPVYSAPTLKTTQSKGDDSQLIAVISSAVSRYRKDHDIHPS